MGMEATIGYGGTPQREPVRPVFVVRGSETAAAVGDEGWDEVEQAFFVGGAVLDQNLSLLPSSRGRRVRLWATAVGAAALAGLAALLWL